MRTCPTVLALATTLALSAAAHAAQPSANATGRAKGLLDGNAAKLAMRADADEFVAKDTIVDADGTEHVRFKRSYRGLPVIGGGVVMHSRNGQLKAVSQRLKTKDRPALAARIDADAAAVEAGAAFDGEVKQIKNKGLVIYARQKEPKLAYEINVVGFSGKRGGFADMRYFVDAATGKVLDGWNQFQTAAATGTGKTLFLGNVTITTNKVNNTKYQLTDPTRGNGNTRNGNGKLIDNVYNTAAIMTDTNNTWGNNAESDVASEATDAYYGIAATWDFYKTTFNRSGIFDDGVGVKSIVNVKFCYDDFCFQQGGGNAGWYGGPYKFMAYGYGDSSWYPVVAIDVAGHEMTHGVTEATAELAYSGDAGGLNESSSDIMGTMVEYFANSPSDPGDYMIGEEIQRSNPAGTTALRYMFKPSRDGESHDCYPAGGFPADDQRTNNPHFTSGVGNHFFYLLAEGAVSPAGFSYTASQLVCNGDTTIAGIGRDAAKKIWYRALTVYMGEFTTYPEARTATLNAAKDLYGLNSTQYNAVARAWTAVSVN